jgi:hypothetical protein
MHITSKERNRAAALAALVLAGCAGAASHRFPLRDPLWVDDDRRAFGPPPEAHENTWIWDGMDNTVFRPLSELWQYEPTREAINVSSIDEVPSSSWFENRIGQRPLSSDDLTTGACASTPVPETPWTVLELKTAGDTPGFVIEAGGRRWLFKTDIRRPELTTAADAIATRIFHAVGYSTPCNHVVALTADDLVIAPDATRGGDSPEDEPLTRADLAEVLSHALPTPDGRLRGSVSAFIDGEPLGGWRFEGRREDDPNDVVPHEHRRDVRGMYVLSAWLDHVDARAECNFDAWVETGDDGRGHVEHYALDLGDAFGLTWDGSDEVTRRFGHSYYFDLEQIGGDLVSLGIADRPYREDPSRPPHPVFTYYDVDRFEPDAWRSGYPVRAFEQRTERDSAWMARILSQITVEQLEALVATGRFSRASVARDLVRILRGRQERIFERYLTRLSPLSFAQVVPQGERSWLCMRDLAVESGIRAPEERRYRATASIDWPVGDAPRELAHRTSGPHVCVPLPDLGVTSQRAARYLVVDLVASTPGRETTGAASVHLYQTGPTEHRIVGLRRLDPG